MADEQKIAICKGVERVDASLPVTATLTPKPHKWHCDEDKDDGQ